MDKQKSLSGIPGEKDCGNFRASTATILQNDDSVSA